MPDTFPAFESRLRQYIRELRRLHFVEESKLFATEQWTSVWNSHTDDVIFQAISDITLPAAKRILNAEQAPTIKDLETLPLINKDTRPGIYLGSIYDNDQPDTHWTYCGVAASTGGQGLSARTAMHLNPDYRAKKKREGCLAYHYALVEQDGTDRYQVYRKLGVAEFPSSRPEDVLFVRVVCLIAECIYTGWLQSYRESDTRFAPWFRLTPWTQTTMFGTNAKPSCLQGFLDPTGTIPVLTREEANDRKNEARKVLKDSEDDNSKDMRKEHDNLYKLLVGNHVQKMKKLGRSEQDIEWHKAHWNLYVNRVAPLPESSREWVRHKHAAVTIPDTYEELCAQTVQRDLASGISMYGAYKNKRAKPGQTSRPYKTKTTNEILASKSTIGPTVFRTPLAESSGNVVPPSGKKRNMPVAEEVQASSKKQMNIKNMFMGLKK